MKQGKSEHPRKSRPKHRILIVDDDADILELLKYNFEREGYEVCVEENGSRSLETAEMFHPDLIVLDIMMPEINGLDVCEKLRALEEFRNTYIFFLTAKSQQFSQASAYDKGGDDFIQKITGLRALSHKVKSVLKKDLVIRKCIREIQLRSLRLNRETLEVYVKGKKISLSNNEFELLYFFAQNPTKAIRRDNLLHNIWGSDIYIIAKQVDTYVGNICTKVGLSIIDKVGPESYRLNLPAL